MALGSWIAVIPAIAVLCFVFQDAFEVMLLPRRVHRRVRLTRFYFLGAWIAWCAIARRLNAGAGRERFLSVFGALSMVILFAVWAVGLILGFGVLQWSLQGAANDGTTLPQRRNLLHARLRRYRSAHRRGAGAIRG